MMKKSLMMFAVLAVGCLSTAGAGVRHVVVASTRLCVAAWRWAVAKVERLTRKAREMLVAWSRPSAAVLAGAQYFRRQAERERPVVSPRWRMAPSV